MREARGKVDAGLVRRQSGVKIAGMRLELIIAGMLAVHAKQGVFTALGGVAGVLRADVSLGRALVEVAAGPAEIAGIEAQLREAVAAAGYRVLEIRRQSRILPTL